MNNFKWIYGFFMSLALIAGLIAYSKEIFWVTLYVLGVTVIVNIIDIIVKTIVGKGE